MKNKVVKLLVLEAVACSIVLGVWALGFRNVDATKAAAEKTWASAGYKIVGYEGYVWGPVCGGNVWYIVRRQNDNGVLYHGALCKWGHEYQIYDLTAIDAIKPN